jgi:hypothetical protein
MTAGSDTLGWRRRPENLQRLVRGVLVLVFLWLAGRFWDPYYGFTKFVQFDETDAAVMLPELRGTPVYVYHYVGGYDGAAYAQLAVRPAANAPELARAVFGLPYRARRILLSWVAYAAGGGDPVRTVQVYAGLNVVLWLMLAWVLAKLFPPQGWRNLVAWAGLLFSAGVLHSVRLALTDVAAFALLAGALWLGETRREHRAVGLLAAAGLVRETALLGGLALWPRLGRGTWRAGIIRLGLMAVPLALWLVYLKFNTGPVVQGLVNFTWPVTGWVEKVGASLHALRTESATWLALTTLLALVGLTVQLAYVLMRWQPADPWWRLGLVYGVLMLCLGTAVWEGHPGAATRILLPLGLAFNVLAVRRAAGVWLIAGNLTVFSGVLALWAVPRDPHELATGSFSGGAFVAQTDERWYPAEHQAAQTWVWCGREGGLQLTTWPHRDGPVGLGVAVRVISARPLEIRQDGRLLWRGEIGERRQWIPLTGVTLAQGVARLELSSPAAPVSEGAAPGARTLGFAVYDLRVE